MFNQDKAFQQLKKLLNNSPLRIIPAKVISVESTSCTVQPLQSDLTLSGIGLFVMGPPESKLIAIPRIGSTVHILPLTERLSLNSLGIAHVFDAETIGMLAGGCYFESSSRGAALATEVGQIDVTPDFIKSSLFTKSFK